MKEETVRVFCTELAMSLKSFTGGLKMGRDEFDFDIDSSKVSTMLKKAKRRQLLKIIVISIALLLFYSSVLL